MKHPEKGPGLLDDVVQRSIASLEHGRERMALITDNARNAYYVLSEEAASLQQQIKAQAGELAQLEQQTAAAGQRLDELFQSGAGHDLLKTAVDELVAARVALQSARDRHTALTRDLESRQLWLKTAGQVAQDGASLTEESATAIELLAENFRELGSHLESAQQSRALGLHVIRAQEEERRRLAREIHDGPTQLLNSVVLRIDVCQRFFDSDLDRLRDELQQLKELVRLSLQDVRKIIFDLRPMALDDLGLIPALRTFLKDYQARTGIETDFAVFGGDRRYDPAFEIAIFRIVQEALTNVFKHAGASRVWVTVETTGGREIRVAVKDDGVGFDPGQIKPGQAGTKFGLVAMRERTELLGGLMEIQSAPGQGSKLTYIFPLLD